MRDTTLDPRPGALRFSVLGPLAAEARGRALSLGPLKQRLVLAMLLCRPNALVSVDLLTEAVWDEEPPRTARKNLQGYVSALRKTLAEAGAGDRLVHRPGGYLLRLGESELDALRFQALARAGREAAADGDAERAARLLRDARMLWAGVPLPELACSEPLRAEAERLAARHVTVCEDWAEAALEAGHAREVTETTGDLVERYPLRERLRAVQMTALHRSGRRAEALAAYDELRQNLSRELGLPPSPVLESLYRSILADTSGPSGPSGPSGGARVVRRRPPVQLPPDLADFTGREETVAELLQVAEAGDAVRVVVGPAGAGKTALTVRAAHRLANEFPGGRIFVRLRGDDGAPRPLASVTTELLGHTDVPAGAADGDSGRATALWRAWLADRKVLVVLDGAADEAAVRPLLPGTGRSAVLVTARTQLAGLAPAHRVQVPPLTTPEALDLLGRLVGAGRVSCDRPAAERIVTACGSLPLAVRAAGLKLAVLRHLPLAEYADRLSDASTVFDELVVADIDVRSHMADQWRQLDGARRTALRRLAALPLSGTFTVEEAAAALECGQTEARRELELMIEAGAVASPRSEVTAHATAYSLPRLPHLYAREKASAAGS
ncbi:AfsR/SARP family transcriptional regulator [Streptomyces shenzhenensis]|uniref:AfsR/SARP family transcriptional regulator n=1 Tax=Streptomyces shenzhenensis TaxID=943815 RepID=UPI0015F11361|nr:BTAD domain-containing putative transcriptional regulator [Streptomyces shenzhenensis]